MSGQLFFGDNLHILKEYVRSDSIDLIYLDPPFNSNASYNLLFKGPAGRQAEAQIEAFDDTWHWGFAAAEAYEDVLRSGTNAAPLLKALRSSLGDSDMMAYLAMMSIRLVELHRVLKSTGSLYLHCDPTASHYLKLVLDSIFGGCNFRSEIIWKRTSAHNSAKRWGPVHDVILFYTASEKYTWNKVYQDYNSAYVEAFYRYVDSDGRRYRIGDLTGAGQRQGESGAIWREINPTSKGRHWAPPRTFPGGSLVPKNALAALDYLDSVGRIYWPPKINGVPGFKRYLEDMNGVQIQDIIDDIGPVSSQSKDRIGYPTQKPFALLERIIAASSNKGDIILDPFCGCGTAVHAAERNERNWIGIDVTFPAIQVINDRLRHYAPAAQYEIGGIPKTLEDAEALATLDKFQFQFWAVALIGGHSKSGRGADHGIDGQFFFKLDAKADGVGLISVKGGKNLNPSMVRDLRGTMEREGAEMAVFVCIGEPSAQMVTEAASAGFFTSSQGRHPRLQIKTIRDLLQGNGIDSPLLYTTVSMAESNRKSVRASQQKLAIPSRELLRQRNLLLPIIGGNAKGHKGQVELPFDQHAEKLSRAINK
ncbi:MAG: DNA methyltransferase [Asticcacaulis sp.]|uniref:site-specific DNA-methyltransferase n=1 Tax=Asticcacaulis sp. TaxID=1872648 RepID=UPI0039E2CA9B